MRIRVRRKRQELHRDPPATVGLLPKHASAERITSVILGDGLRKARQKAGLTQEELSFRAEVDRTYISMLEHDKKSPTLDVLFWLRDAMGVLASRVIATGREAEGKGNRTSIRRGS